MKKIAEFKLEISVYEGPKGPKDLHFDINVIENGRSAGSMSGAEGIISWKYEDVKNKSGPIKALAMQFARRRKKKSFLHLVGTNGMGGDE